MAGGGGGGEASVVESHCVLIWVSNYCFLVINYVLNLHRTTISTNNFNTFNISWEKVSSLAIIYQVNINKIWNKHLEADSLGMKQALGA